MSQSPAITTPDYATPGDPGAHNNAFLGVSTRTWLRAAILTFLFAALFWPNLRRLWLKTNPFFGEPNWGHSIFVPVIGLYYLYLHREQLARTPIRAAWTGLPIILLGLLVTAYGIYPGQNDYVKDAGMVFVLFGVVTLLCGWQVMKIAWFPVLFLFAAFPWPGLVYSTVAMPLQQIAASAAVFVLRTTGVEALRSGTKMLIMQKSGEFRTLNVAEACAGMKSLMTFLSVGAAVAFLSNRALWQKIIITASAVPIAIGCNTLRVTGQGLLDYYVGPQWSSGFAHQFAGLIMLIPAFFMILLVAWITDKSIIEEADPKAKKKDAVIQLKPGGAKPQAPKAVALKPSQQQAPQPAAAQTPDSAPASPQASDLAEGARRLAAMRAGRKPGPKTQEGT